MQAMRRLRRADRFLIWNRLVLMQADRRPVWASLHPR